MQIYWRKRKLTSAIQIFSWDAFLELSLHALDIEVQSKIIELQDRYKDLQARQAIHMGGRQSH